MWFNTTFAITYYLVFFVVHWRMWHKVKYHLKRRDAWEDLALMDDNPNAKDTLMSMNGKATGINKMHHKLPVMRQKMKAKTAARAALNTISAFLRIWRLLTGLTGGIRGARESALCPRLSDTPILNQRVQNRGDSQPKNHDDGGIRVNGEVLRSARVYLPC